MKKVKVEKVSTGMFRQGDVLAWNEIAKVDKANAVTVPAKTSEIPREGGMVVLQHGTVTGHSHAIRHKAARFVRVDGQGDRFLLLEVAAKLEHEEHDTVPLPAGKYRVRIQREWAGEISRRVED